MPDFLMDYHLSWLDFWADHPIAFWLMVGFAAVLCIGDSYLRRMDRR